MAELLIGTINDSNDWSFFLQAGAILGLLGYAWSKHPDLAFDIELLDYVVGAGDVLWGILAFSVLGIMFKAKTLNHTAHLSGALFGM